jgi:hypothetical protein
MIGRSTPAFRDLFESFFGVNNEDFGERLYLCGNGLQEIIIENVIDFSELIPKKRYL